MGSYKADRVAVAQKRTAPASSLHLLERTHNPDPASSIQIQRLRSGQPAQLSAGEILRLQQSIGNQAVMRLLNQRTPASNSISRKRIPQENKTGLPDSLKAGVENLAGHSL